MRQCVGCGEMKNKREMIRVIKTSENEIILDATGKKNGRGMQIFLHRLCDDALQLAGGKISGFLPDNAFGSGCA